MNTNETICKWLGLSYTNENDKIIHFDKITARYVVIDFLHSRDQQKWIEDKLEKEGYLITYILTEVFHYSGVKRIWKIVIVGEPHSDIIKTNKSKDTAFIEAVLELIEKENAR